MNNLKKKQQHTFKLVFHWVLLMCGNEWRTIYMHVMVNVSACIYFVFNCHCILPTSNLKFDNYLDYLVLCHGWFLYIFMCVYVNSNEIWNFKLNEWDKCNETKTSKYLVQLVWKIMWPWKKQLNEGKNNNNNTHRYTETQACTETHNNPLLTQNCQRHIQKPIHILHTYIKCGAIICFSVFFSFSPLCFRKFWIAKLPWFHIHYFWWIVKLFHLLFKTNNHVRYITIIMFYKCDITKTIKLIWVETPYRFIVDKNAIGTRTSAEIWFKRIFDDFISYDIIGGSIKFGSEIQLIKRSIHKEIFIYII